MSDVWTPLAIQKGGAYIRKPYRASMHCNQVPITLPIPLCQLEGLAVTSVLQVMRQSTTVRRPCRCAQSWSVRSYLHQYSDINMLMPLAFRYLSYS